MRVCTDSVTEYEMDDLEITVFVCKVFGEVREKSGREESEWEKRGDSRWILLLQLRST